MWTFTIFPQFRLIVWPWIRQFPLFNQISSSIIRQGCTVLPSPGVQWFLFFLISNLIIAVEPQIDCWMLVFLCYSSLHSRSEFLQGQSCEINLLLSKKALTLEWLEHQNQERILEPGSGWVRNLVLSFCCWGLGQLWLFLLWHANHLRKHWELWFALQAT